MALVTKPFPNPIVFILVDTESWFFPLVRHGMKLYIINFDSLVQDSTYPIANVLYVGTKHVVCQMC